MQPIDLEEPFDFDLKFRPMFRNLCKEKQNVINGICSTLIDMPRPFMLSPFVENTIDISSFYFDKLLTRYGFSEKKLKSTNSNPKPSLLRENDYFQIADYNLIMKWENIQPQYIVKTVSENVEKHYGKPGLCHFNRVIFSENKKYALVEYYISYGQLSGFGQTSIMEKINNKWVKIDTLSSSLG